MNAKKLLIALAAAALIVPVGAVAQLDPLDTNGPDVEAQTIVEGHTVWTEIFLEQGADAAALAVLVRERQAGQVLWFDDSFLHQTQEDFKKCEGAVWATNVGVPLNPLGSPVADYVITDPFGVQWTTVVYNTDPENLNPVTRKWAVSLYDTPNLDGTGCYLDESATHFYADGTQEVDLVPYNALLWFDLGFFEAPLTTGTPKEYGNGGANDAEHTSEGNSHAHNPTETTDHGPVHSHNTFQVDLYWNSFEPTPSGNVVFTNNPDFANHHVHP